MAGTSVGELFVELFFKADQIKLKDFIASVGELNMASIASSLGLGALYNGMEKVLTASAGTAVEVNKFTSVTGLSGEKMQQFENAAQKAGLSAGTFKSAVVGLQQSILKMQLTGEGSNFFSGYLGLNPYEAIDTMAMLEKLVTRIKTFPKEKQAFLMGQVGLNPELLAMNFEKVKEEVFQAAEQTKQMMQYVEASTGFSISIKALWSDIASSTAPAIVEAMKEMSALMDSIHKSGFIPQFAKALADIMPTTSNILAWNNMAAGAIQGGLNMIPGVNIPYGQGGGKGGSNTYNVYVQNPEDARKAMRDIVVRHYEEGEHQHLVIK